ncbi:TetR/AcrR family transcriptional regulator [Novosphingobium soli]|uniref:TetR/AcrR family transcriptional regulator n=1 Tax=Novosphingobium soli TaxID=574956 RepID=A0ABV6CTX6_9SPHN
MAERIGKRELNKARKRAQIVRLASRMFLDESYATTTMSAIADALGGSKATLWAHFSAKEELFAAVVDLHVETFSSDIDEVLTGQAFSVPALRRACLRFIDCLLRENSVLLYRLVMSEGDRFPEVKETFYTRGPAKLRACITDFFATRFHRTEALRLTQIVVSAVTGYRSDVLLRPSRSTRAQHEAFVDSLLELIAWPCGDDGAKTS